MTSAFGLFPFCRCGNQGRQRPRHRSRQRQSWGQHRTFPALSPGVSHLHRAGQPFSVQGQVVCISAFDRRPQSLQLLRSALPGERKAALGAIQMNEGRFHLHPLNSHFIYFPRLVKDNSSFNPPPPTTNRLKNIKTILSSWAGFGLRAADGGLWSPAPGPCRFVLIAHGFRAVCFSELSFHITVTRVGLPLLVQR